MNATASQTLQRGLDLIEAVARGEASLAALVSATGLTQSTAHRLASVLVARDYLVPGPRGGYRLGPSALRIGREAGRQVDLVRVARPHLEALAAATGDTACVAVLDRGAAVHLEEVPGRRRILVSRRIGERLALDSTALGRVLRDRIAVAGTDEDRIHCAAAPVRRAGGAVVAAVGVSSAAQYIDAARIDALATAVNETADAIGRELGWNGRQGKGAEA